MFNDFLAERHWPLLEKNLPLATVQPAGSPFKNAGVSLWLQKQPEPFPDVMSLVADYPVLLSKP